MLNVLLFFIFTFFMGIASPESMVSSDDIIIAEFGVLEDKVYSYEDPEIVLEGLTGMADFVAKHDPDEMSAKTYRYIYEALPRDLPKNNSNLKTEQALYKLWKALHQEDFYRESQGLLSYFSQGSGLKQWPVGSKSEIENHYQAIKSRYQSFKKI